MDDQPEKVLIYAGPSLDYGTIAEQLPDCEVIVKGPVRHGDFSTDLLECEPSHVLIIEGLFHQNLSVWHKEIVWALQMPGIKGIYGAASMGALRAADLAPYGMIGCGRIFRWFYEGITFKEADVASAYGLRTDANVISSALTVPMVNVYGALLKALEDGVIDEGTAEYFVRQERAVHWTQRTLRHMDPNLAKLIEQHDQKKIDALELLCTFRKLEPEPGATKLGIEALSGLFTAQFERDRSVNVGGRPVKLQDLDAFVMLHDQEYDQHSANADYRILALMLADIYRITLSYTELDTEWQRFNVRMNLRSLEEHNQWLKDNHVNARELVRILSDEVRLRKLRRALMVRSGPRRHTQRLLDYLKLNRNYTYWANAAAAHEELIAQKGGEESLELGGETNVAILLNQHARKAGLTIPTSLGEYVREAGFGTVRELMVALSRDKLGDNAELPRQ